MAWRNGIDNATPGRLIIADPSWRCVCRVWQIAEIVLQKGEINRFIRIGVIIGGGTSSGLIIYRLRAKREYNVPAGNAP